MKSSNTGFIHSKYFNSCFNSALFDGPFRIYFPNHHEGLALKIFFSLQQVYMITPIRRQNKKQFLEPPSTFLMIYPSEDLFVQAFEEKASRVSLRALPIEALMKNENLPLDKSSLVNEDLSRIFTIGDDVFEGDIILGVHAKPEEEKMILPLIEYLVYKMQWPQPTSLAQISNLNPSLAETEGAEGAFKKSYIL